MAQPASLRRMMPYAIRTPCSSLHVALANSSSVIGSFNRGIAIDMTLHLETHRWHPAEPTANDSVPSRHKPSNGSCLLGKHVRPFEESGAHQRTKIPLPQPLYDPIIYTGIGKSEPISFAITEDTGNRRCTPRRSPKDNLTIPVLNRH